MKRKFIFTLILVNVLLFVWGAYGLYIFLQNDFLLAVDMVSETPVTVSLSVDKISQYSDEDKKANVDEVIRLYVKLSEYIDWNKRFTLEMVESLFQYIAGILIVSFLNILLIILFVQQVGSDNKWGQMKLSDRPNHSSGKVGDLGK